jgi:DNA-binding GntR family transcriptional regulator
LIGNPASHTGGACKEKNLTDSDLSSRRHPEDDREVPGKVEITPRAASLSKDSMRNTAYERIKSAIIKTQYRGGQFLNVAALAKDLGMGRTPIHEAIMRLDQEGLVDLLPRKGVVVRSATLSEARDIAAIRALNEAQCAAWAAERVDRQGIERLSAILDAAGNAIKARDVEKALLLDLRFHTCISDIAGNYILAGILSNLHERSHRYWYLSFSSIPHMEKVQVQHHAIFEAIRDQDPKRASRASRRHVEKFLENVTRLF